MDINLFKKIPLLGILRGINVDMVAPIVEISVSAGLYAIEITMNTSGASELIRRMVNVSENRLAIGAGTVLSTDDYNSAVNSGATFIVSPVLVPEVARLCKKNNTPFFPGAYTPQEIFNAWNAGATMVKVFPAKFCGSEYFKEIKGPFNDIELLACGGVDEKSIKSFFLNQASAVAFGGSVFKKDRLEKGDYLSIEENINKLISLLPSDLRSP